MIYFVQVNHTGPVKIGYTRVTPSYRLTFLQCGNPFKLNIRGVIQGTKADEQNLHRKFRQHRIRGEWFKHRGNVKQFVRALKPYKDSTNIRSFPFVDHKKVARFISTFYAKNRYCPSYEEISKGVGLKSKSGINRIILELEESGHIRRLAGHARAIEVVRMP